MTSALTPTSYAILGLLALKPWTTYELAQQMERALGQFWPRAQSRLYEEPKKLIEHGLARATSEMVGKRQRTIYTITPKGQRALAKWVPAPGQGPVIEFEDLIKVFFAEHAGKADLLATLANVRERSEEKLAASAGVPQAYLEGKGQFPDRLPWLLLVGQFLIDYYQMIERWAAWASDVVGTWPEDLLAASPDLAALENQAAVTAARVRRP